MYIEKNIMTDLGINATHHELQALHIYFDINEAHVDVVSYISDEAKNNGGHPIETQQLVLSQTNFENVVAIYNAILQTATFSGGILHE